MHLPWSRKGSKALAVQREMHAAPAKVRRSALAREEHGGDAGRFAVPGSRTQAAEDLSDRKIGKGVRGVWEARSGDDVEGPRMVCVRPLARCSGWCVYGHCPRMVCVRALPTGGVVEKIAYFLLFTVCACAAHGISHFLSSRAPPMVWARPWCR